LVKCRSIELPFWLSFAQSRRQNFTDNFDRDFWERKTAAAPKHMEKPAASGRRDVLPAAETIIRAAMQPRSPV
jgi:hypothetical protein